MCSRYFGANAYQAVYAAALYHVGHLGVEFGGGQSGLQNVRQDERFRLVALFRTAVHEVERNVERGDIGVVSVVDEGAASHALHHFETHGHGFELRHALCYVGGLQV